nr:translation initiation factor IF-2 [Oryctolagus cuniculus]
MTSFRAAAGAGACALRGGRPAGPRSPRAAAGRPPRAAAPPWRPARHGRGLGATPPQPRTGAPAPRPLQNIRGAPGPPEAAPQAPAAEAEPRPLGHRGRGAPGRPRSPPPPPHTPGPETPAAPSPWLKNRTASATQQHRDAGATGAPPPRRPYIEAGPPSARRLFEKPPEPSGRTLPNRHRGHAPAPAPWLWPAPAPGSRTTPRRERRAPPARPRRRAPSRRPLCACAGSAPSGLLSPPSAGASAGACCEMCKKWPVGYDSSGPLPTSRPRKVQRPGVQAAPAFGRRAGSSAVSGDWVLESCCGPAAAVTGRGLRSGAWASAEVRPEAGREEGEGRGSPPGRLPDATASPCPGAEPRSPGRRRRRGSGKPENPLFQEKVGERLGA